MHINIIIKAAAPSKAETLTSVNQQLTAAAEAHPDVAGAFDVIATAVRPAIEALPDAEGLTLCRIDLMIGVAHTSPIAEHEHAIAAAASTEPN